MKTLHWSLKYGGFTIKNPYDDDNTPPIHLCVQLEKLKSLKVMIESIDRMRGQKDIDFPWDDEDGLTPLMVAAQQCWTPGARLLLENGADMAKKDRNGKTARMHATENNSKGMIKFFDEWESDAPVAELSAAELAKKAEILEKNKEASDKRHEEKLAIEKENAKKEAEKEKLEQSIKRAASNAAWPEVKEALADVKRELSINRTADDDDNEVDPSLWKLASLQVLQLRLKKEALTSLPPDFGQLIGMTDLNLSQNSLTSLPEEIANLTALKAFNCEFNCLTSLPSGIGNCTKLEVVKLTGNQLESIAPLAKAAAVLHVLHVSQNQLKTIDIPLDKSPRLAQLTASNNLLTAIPSKIGKCSKLKMLKVANNQIKELSDEISDLKELLDIDVDGNPLKDKKIAKILETGHNPAKDLKTYLAKSKKKGK